MNKSGETLQGIVTSVKRVTDIVAEIDVAAAEQSTGIEQVNKAMSQMDSVTQSNSAQTEELSSTAESLASQSAKLMQLVGTFTLSKDDKETRNLAAPAPDHTGGHRTLGPAKRREDSGSRFISASRVDRRSSASAQQISVHQPAFAAVAPEDDNDDSFQEF